MILIVLHGASMGISSKTELECDSTDSALYPGNGNVTDWQKLNLWCTSTTIFWLIMSWKVLVSTGTVVYWCRILPTPSVLHSRVDTWVWSLGWGDVRVLTLSRHGLANLAESCCRSASWSFLTGTRVKFLVWISTLTWLKWNLSVPGSFHGQMIWSLTDVLS